MDNSKSRSQIEPDKMVEILKNQLYFAVIKGLSGKKIRSTLDALYFSIDDEFQYQNYYYDFGPYNISYLYKYCIKLNKYLEYSQGQKRVVHCTSTSPEKKVNAAYLIGCYCVIYLKFHPAEISKILMKVGPFKSFMDASQSPCPFTIELEFCFNAIAKATAFNFFDFEDFDVNEYEMYEKLQYGDMNWLVPRKFLAFIGPISNSEFLNGHPPHYYIKYFLKNDIKTVIRLNNKMYDSYVFTNAGIEHFDLIYPDGSTPSKDILLKFFHITETAPAAIAVHCKAGLGRTGSLIGAYIVKHYRMTAKEAIAWMRICRPGSVIGQQQLWLEKLEPWLWKCGNLHRCKHYGDGDKIPRHKFGIYSKTWPVERAKILRSVRQKFISQYLRNDGGPPVTQSNRKSSAQFSRNNQLTNPVTPRTRNLAEPRCFEDISEYLTNVYGFGKNRSKKPNRTKPNLQPVSLPQPPKRSSAIVSNRPKMNLEPSLKIPSKSVHYASIVSPKNWQNDEIIYDYQLNPQAIPFRMRYPSKVDHDTDTSNYIHSYMEEKARKKAAAAEASSMKNSETQGDKLNQRKVIKNNQSFQVRKLAKVADYEQSNEISTTNMRNRENFIQNQ